MFKTNHIDIQAKLLSRCMSAPSDIQTNIVLINLPLKVFSNKYHERKVKKYDPQNIYFIDWKILPYNHIAIQAAPTLKLLSNQKIIV